MDADTVRATLRADHGETLARATDRLADAAAATDPPTERAVAAAAVERAVTDTALGPPLVATLVDVVAACGESLPAEPVPAPPYVVPTARGVLLRATTDAGRLVVTLRAFDLRPDGRYGAVPAGEERLAVTVR